MFAIICLHRIWTGRSLAITQMFSATLRLERPRLRWAPHNTLPAFPCLCEVRYFTSSCHSQQLHEVQFARPHFIVLHSNPPLSSTPHTLQDANHKGAPHRAPHLLHPHRRLHILPHNLIHQHNNPPHTITSRQ